ncbi:hypothetical protein [Cellulomonas sp. URHB0016]
MRPRFEDTYVSREEWFTLGVDVVTGGFYASVPVRNRRVEYSEYYALSADEYRAYLADPEAALPFVEACRRHEHDDRLLLAPGSDRGSPI